MSVFTEYLFNDITPESGGPLLIKLTHWVNTIQMMADFHVVAIICYLELVSYVCSL